MNLDEIQEMWQRDSVIDPDNLHDESLRIPQLHSKYYTLYNTITLLRERSRDSYSRVKLERYNYYTGKAPAEVYVEEPFPYKVREKDAIQRHLEADGGIGAAGGARADASRFRSLPPPRCPTKVERWWARCTARELTPLVAHIGEFGRET